MQTLSGLSTCHYTMIQISADSDVYQQHHIGFWGTRYDFNRIFSVDRGWYLPIWPVLPYWWLILKILIPRPILISRF